MTWQDQMILKNYKRLPTNSSNRQKTMTCKWIITKMYRWFLGRGGWVAVTNIINFGHENLHILNYSNPIKRAVSKIHINESYGSSPRYTWYKSRGPTSLDMALTLFWVKMCWYWHNIQLMWHHLPEHNKATLRNVKITFLKAVMCLNLIHST